MAAMVVQPPLKRRRDEDLIVYQQPEEEENIRASSLTSPTLQLTGHTGSVYALQYSPSGETLLSASFDMTCLLWRHGDYDNYNVLKGHKNAVLDCVYLDEESVVTASADKTLMLWDANTGIRLKKWTHAAIVNATCRVTDQLVASACDDKSCWIWDRRQRKAAHRLKSDYPMLAVAATPDLVLTSGIDNLIHCWDRKMERRVFSLQGHTDTVTSLALHPDQTHVLSNSMDQTLRSWDIRPYVNGKRHHKTFVGHKHNAEKGLLKCSWSSSNGGSMVSCGSADRMVHIWDEFSTQELYLLPGHKGCVNTVAFHPKENVIASGASDKQIFVGELS